MYKYLKGECKEDENKLFSVVPWAQTETWKVPSEQKETLFYYQDNCVLEHDPRIVESPSLEILRSCLDTLLGNIL